MITNKKFIVAVSLQSNVVDFCYFKLRIKLSQLGEVCNMKGLRHQVAKILENWICDHNTIPFRSKSKYGRFTKRHEII